MVAPPKPANEAQRLAALRALNVLDTPAEERFDRITRLVQRLLGTPMALVSLVDADRQWLKSAQGTNVSESARDISFCGHAILEPDTFVVEDALLDARFSDNPLVTGPMGVRFYAGHPIHATDGSAIGTLCALDRAPRTLDAADRAALRDLAILVEGELQRTEAMDVQMELLQERDELLRRAMVDGLTRVWNRTAILELLDGQFSRAQRGGRLAVAMIDADHFKSVNDTYGHQAGDDVLAELASRMRAGLRPSDPLGRYGGEEFCAILADCDTSVVETLAERVRLSVANQPMTTIKGPVPLTISIGIAYFSSTMQSASDLLAEADRALYLAKAAGRNQVVLA